VRDVRFGTNVLVSVSANGASADGDSSEPAISGNGRYVAFTSWADNLVSADSNRTSDVFLRDVLLGTTTLVSVNTSGTASGNNASYSPLISSNGRFVLFRSMANNLAAGSFSVAENLFLRDVQTGTNYALTTSGLDSASMTPNGGLVAFADMAGASTGKIYVWDSEAAARIETNSTLASVTNISISPDGNRIACFAGPGTVVLVDRVAGTSGPIGSGYAGSRAGLRFGADGHFLTYAAAPTATGTNQVYLYDFQAASNLLVSSAFGLNVGGSASSDSPDISADGRFVAYRSFATNLLAVNTSNAVPNLFLYDRLAGTTTLLSASRLTGGPGDNRSLAPVFSADGRTLLFQSWASDLVPVDFNHWDDVFALAFLYVSITPGSAPGQGPTVTWPARPGETYQVQFKNSLGDINWQDVVGIVIFQGNQAYLTDLAPSTGQRFYRVMAF
jgi:Tol biopolymer transport system component